MVHCYTFVVLLPLTALNPAVHEFRGELLNLVLSSGWVARVVLAILLLFSIISWGIILQKYFQLKTLNFASAKFVKVFQNYGPLQEIMHAAQRNKRSPLAQIFLAAYTELRRYQPRESDQSRESQLDPAQVPLILESVSRCMGNASMLVRSKLDKYLIFLATTGSVTPFIGLFGTVWGIMNAFRGIGLHGSANLAIVAPGIAEALIATAGGLFAAIPGVIAFNYFQRKILVFSMELEYFSSDVLNYFQHRYLFPSPEKRVSTGERTP